jgi:hypothetical protein
MNSGQDTDYAKNTGSMSGLQVERCVADVEYLSHIINSSCLHGSEDHVWSGTPILDVIAADVSREDAPPTSGTEYAVSY